MTERKNVLIIGAGLTGSLLSIFLGKREFQVEVYEKRQDTRNMKLSTSYRTIGMSLSERGLLALDKVGIKDLIVRDTTPTYGRISYHNKQKIIHYYSSNNESILTVDRKMLNEQIINTGLAYKNINYFFGYRLIDIDFDHKICIFDFNGDIYTKSYDYLIGADGVFSISRTVYEKKLNITSQLINLPIGYKEFTIPYACSSTKTMEKTLIHAWTSRSKDSIMVALPSEQRQAFLVNIFCPIKWVEFFETNNSKDLIVDYLSAHFKDLVEVLSEIDVESLCGKTSRMYQVQNRFWNYKDSFLLIGDATHAISPFYAMGMNLSFESCMVLDDLLENTDNDLSWVISIFQGHRKADTDAMQELAYENFTSIAVSNSEYYRNIWLLERELYNLFPSILVPEYHRIAFTTQPLRLVRKYILLQRAILKEISDPVTGIINDTYKNNSELIYPFFVKHGII